MSHFTEYKFLGEEHKKKVVLKARHSVLLL